MNIAWSGDDPLGVDEGRYKFLETFLGNQSRLWMRDAAKAGGTTELSSSLWNSVAVGKEGFESVHAWQVCQSVQCRDHMLTSNRRRRCTYITRDTSFRDEGIDQTSIPYNLEYPRLLMYLPSEYSLSRRLASRSPRSRLSMTLVYITGHYKFGFGSGARNRFGWLCFVYIARTLIWCVPSSLLSRLSKAHSTFFSLYSSSHPLSIAQTVDPSKWP
jgi:hypothetical protein